MARQPFLPKYRDDKTWTLGNTWTTTKPRLASLIIQAISGWPFVELELATVLGTLLGAKEAPTVAAYTALRQFRLNRDVISAAASVALTEPKDLALLEALLAVIRTTSGLRDDLAHGLWGESQALPDALLWVEAKHAAPWAMHNRAGEGSDPMHEALAAHLFVYTQADLQDAVTAMDEMWRLTAMMGAYLQLRGPSRDQQYGLLCREPRILEALNRQNDS
jgi:hypothetical protein